MTQEGEDKMLQKQMGFPDSLIDECVQSSSAGEGGKKNLFIHVRVCACVSFYCFYSTSLQLIKKSLHDTALFLDGLLQKKKKKHLKP